MLRWFQETNDLTSEWKIIHKKMLLILQIEYETLAKQCQDFAVDLLDQVRGSKELEILLNYDRYSPVRDRGDRMDLARLKLAIKYKQKKVKPCKRCLIKYDKRWEFYTKFSVTVCVPCQLPATTGFYLVRRVARFQKAAHNLQGSPNDSHFSSFPGALNHLHHSSEEQNGTVHEETIHQVHLSQCFVHDLSMLENMLMETKP